MEKIGENSFFADFIFLLSGISSSARLLPAPKGAEILRTKNVKIFQKIFLQTVDKCIFHVI